MGDASSNKNSLDSGPISFMTRHAVAANLIMIFCLVGGFLLAGQIKQEVFPDLTFDMVTVSVPYPGASPEEVEQGIVLAVEEAVNGLEGVDEVTSVAREGSGVVNVELLEGADLQKLATDIENEVDRITTFPEDAEDAKVTIVDRKRHVLTLVLYGDVPDKTLEGFTEQVREELLQLKEVTQVEIDGIKGLEISVEVSEKVLRKYGLKLSDIADKISSNSVEIPAGGIKTDKGEILVRVKDRKEYGNQFAKIPIITAQDGTAVYLEDIAVIKDAYEDVDYSASFDGKNAAEIDVYRVGEQTPIEVSDAVKKYMRQLKKQLPNGLNISIRNDMSKIFEQRMDLLIRNGSLGLALVLVILGLFLNIRLAFWVMMGIPISFLGSFLILPMLGVSINLISMFAYIIALGIVVDDAIVVGENIYHHRQQGMYFLEASIKGAKEVAVPITFSILTNIVAFLPLYFLPGVMGKVFKIIPMVVCTVFAISLFESLFVLPAHLKHVGRSRFGILTKIQRGFSQGFTSWTKSGFAPALERVLKFRYLVICLAIMLLAVSVAYVKSGRLGFSMFPKVEADFADVEVVLPYGTPIEKTMELSKRFVNAAQKVAKQSGHEELLKGVFAKVGRDGSHSLIVKAYLADAEIRKEIMGTAEFTKKWRKNVGDVLEAEYVKFSSDKGGPGHGRALTIRLSHSNKEELEKAAFSLSNSLKSFSMVSDVDDGFEKGKQQLDFSITPKGEALGLSSSYIARQVRNFYQGAEAVRQQRGRKEIKVKVRLFEAERESLFSLDEMIILTPSGGQVPLKEVAKVKKGRAYTKITRNNGRRVVDVTADVTPPSMSNMIISQLNENILPSLLENHKGLTYSFEGRQAEERESMGSLITGFVLAMMIIYVLLALPFESYFQPMVVMISIPFGIIGAVVGHILLGYSLSVMSMMGIVALSGVVVNDSLVLIEYANKIQKQRNLHHFQAVLEAGVQRLRPVILTTLTTFFGLMPMIFETDMQARFLIPMAISLGFGILFVTFITLALVPSLYVVLEDVKIMFANLQKAFKKLF
jgi:multidrug efflux pump subunit AcrB